MARTPFRCEVLTPDGEVFNDEEYPEQAFYLVGNLDEMRAKAADLTKKSKK